jgi:Heavy metal associated domain 2
MAQDGMSASDVSLEGGGNRPLASTHVVHSIPGRVRLRVPTLKTNSNLVRGLQGLLSAQAGVTEVTVAPVCQSVTVVHDPAQWTPESLCMFLQSRNREELELWASAALPDAATSSFAMTWLQPWRYLNTAENSSDSMGVPQTAGPVKSGYWKVGYASMVVGVAMFAVPGIPGVPFLMLSTYCFSKASTLKTGDEPEAGEQVSKAGQ